MYVDKACKSYAWSLYVAMHGLEFFSYYSL